uniref:Uncharacterized protein n=1 Tax=Musa acuminata subsp. malaccensis TaxID=214687 RepID=A0A804IXV1_MUSAM
MRLARASFTGFATLFRCSIGLGGI